MCWLYQTMLACLIWAAMMPCAPGEALPEPLVHPPESGVLDAGGLFQRDAAALGRISEKLLQLEKERGYRMYVIVEPVFISTTAKELAARLQQAWLPDGNGLVIVFEGDSRSLGFGEDFGKEPDAMAPTHETTALLQESLNATDADLAPDVYLETLVGNLVRGFNDYFKRRAAPRPPGRTLRFALLTIGGLALLALGTVAVGALSRMQSVVGSRILHFPSVNQPERLGAPSGGKVVSRSYRLRD